jgi:hypothetical protein
MKLINGTEMIDNSPNEKAGELAEAIFDDVVFILDLEEKCIMEDEDGNSCNTELGQDLFNGIYEQCMNYFEREDIEPQSNEAQHAYAWLDIEEGRIELYDEGPLEIRDDGVYRYLGKIKIEEDNK